MRVTTGEVYHQLIVLGAFGRAVSAYGIAAPMFAGSDDDPHIYPEDAIAELCVGYDVLLRAAACERGFAGPLRVPTFPV